MIDIERGESPLGSQYGYGWLSGSAIKPLAGRSVFEVACVTDKPVIGVGGVTYGEDVIEFFMAGASSPFSKAQPFTERLPQKPPNGLTRTAAKALKKLRVCILKNISKVSA